MSVKRPRLQRRRRVVDAEDCPACGSKIGETCKSYKGSGCAPHAVPMALNQGKTFAVKPVEYYWTQGSLYD